MDNPTFFKDYVTSPNKGTFQLVSVETIRSSSERRGDNLSNHISSENDTKY